MSRQVFGVEIPRDILAIFHIFYFDVVSADVSLSSTQQMKGRGNNLIGLSGILSSFQGALRTLTGALSRFCNFLPSLFSSLYA